MTDAIYNSYDYAHRRYHHFRVASLRMHNATDSQQSSQQSV